MQTHTGPDIRMCLSKKTHLTGLGVCGIPSHVYTRDSACLWNITWHTGFVNFLIFVTFESLRTLFPRSTFFCAASSGVLDLSKKEKAISKIKLSGLICEWRQIGFVPNNLVLVCVCFCFRFWLKRNSKFRNSADQFHRHSRTALKLYFIFISESKNKKFFATNIQINENNHYFRKRCGKIFFSCGYRH